MVKTSKIHRAMEELGKMRNSSDRTLRRLIILITLLLCTGTGYWSLFP